MYRLRVISPSVEAESEVRRSSEVLLLIATLLFTLYIDLPAKVKGQLA